MLDQFKRRTSTNIGQVKTSEQFKRRTYIFLIIKKKFKGFLKIRNCIVKYLKSHKIMKMEKQEANNILVKKGGHPNFIC